MFGSQQHRDSSGDHSPTGGWLVGHWDRQQKGCVTPRLWGEGIEPAKQFEKEWAEEREDSQAVTSLQARGGTLRSRVPRRRVGPGLSVRFAMCL